MLDTPRDMIGYEWNMPSDPPKQLPRFTPQEMRLLGFHGAVTRNPSVSWATRFFR